MATKKRNQGATPTDKNQPESTKANSAQWPRGVHVRKRGDREGWQVGWSISEGGARRRKFKLFALREQAEAFADELAAQVRERGRQVLSFDPVEWQRWLDFKREIEGESLLEVLGVWRSHLVRRRKTQLLLSKAMENFIEMFSHEGWGRSHVSHVEKHLGRLADFAGAETPLLDLTADVVREWLVSLEDEGAGDGEGFAVGTIRSHLKSARIFFNRAVAENWIEDNPADSRRVKGPKIVGTEKIALSLAEARQLFAANREQRVCGRLALEAFAGVRYTGAGRLKQEDVNWQDRFILLPARQHKSGERYVLDGLPENLWAWLRHADKIEKFWEMTERQYLEEKSAAFARAGVENPGNVLRRSFCSWRIALDGDARKVATMMQHRNPEMLYRQYKTSKTREGWVTQKDAPGWEKILP